MIGVDTTVLIDLFKQEEAVIQALQEINEELVLNDLTHLELTIGINPKDNEHQQEEQFYKQYYKQFNTLPLSHKAAKETQKIIWKLKKQRQQIPLIDATIAGIYLANNIKKILTRNAKDFKKIPGLQIITY